MTCHGRADSDPANWLFDVFESSQRMMRESLGNQHYRPTEIAPGRYVKQKADQDLIG